MGMKAKKRYLLVFSSVAFLVFWYFGGPKFLHPTLVKNEEAKNAQLFTPPPSTRDSYLDPWEEDEPPAFAPPWGAPCRFPTCFNLTRCGDTPRDFRIHVYDENPEEEKSEVFRKILSVLRASPYATDDPNEACLFISGADTLDR